MRISMSQFLSALSTTAHSLATTFFIGYYFIMAVLVLPNISKGESTGYETLSRISKQSRWWLYGSLAILALTGAYLTFADPNYAGIGQFDTPWAILMLAKHIVIVLMILFGFWFNAIKRVGKCMLSTSNAAAAYLRFKRYILTMSLLGLIVLILTGIGQTI